MRIALFTESYFPVVNGVSTSVQTLCRELTARGHEPVVIAPHFPDYQEKGDTFPVLRLPSWRTPLNPQNPFAYPPIGPLPRVLRGERFDIVHTQQPFGVGLQGARIAKLQGIPLLTTFHTLYMEYGHYFPFLPNQLIVAGVGLYLRRYYERCATVIVPSCEAGRRLEAIRVQSKQLSVVPTGVPDAPPVTPESIAAARTAYNLPIDRPVVLFVGRMAKEKNLDLLLTAFAHLYAQRKDAILVIAGDGPYHSACEQIIATLKLSDAVRFTGFLNKSQLAPLYALSRVFAFPSSSETQGVVLCEAQSFGLPCVAVQGGGAPEFVRNGVDALVVPSDAEAFASALHQLLTDDACWNAYSAAARQTPLRLTPAGMVEKIIEIYKRTIAEGIG